MCKTVNLYEMFSISEKIYITAYKNVISIIASIFWTIAPKSSFITGALNFTSKLEEIVTL